MTHYVVETELAHRKGFYGMVADGWDLTDFGAPWPRGPIPEDADPSELIVGFLDAERASGEEWSTADFNDRVADFYTEHGVLGACTASPDSRAGTRALRRMDRGPTRREPRTPVLEALNDTLLRGVVTDYPFSGRGGAPAPEKETLTLRSCRVVPQ
jgi:hypothetical protein